MAYNPFDFFRRNQKVAFAALTIFVMFTFVLSFGAGDFFQWLPGWLRSQRSTGKEVMATVDGRKLYDADLARIEDGRATADQFMQMASDSLSARIANELPEAAAKVGEQNRMFVTAIPRMYRDLRQGRMSPDDALRQYQMLGNFLATKDNDPTLKDEEKSALKKTRTLIGLETRMLTTGRAGYFTNLPRTRQNQEKFDFALWLKKADKLGVKIQASDAEAMVNDEFNGLISKEQLAKLEKGFLNKPGYTRDTIYQALADEYRVRTAMNIVLSPGFSAMDRVVSKASAPGELYQTFKQQCEPGTFAIMTVPVENYMSKVTATPSESELRAMFDKYRSQEPNPAREAPGFREPRKLKMTWVEITGEEPTLKKLGDEIYQISDVTSRLAGLGFGEFAPLTAVPVAMVSEPRLQKAYAAYVGNHENKLRDVWYPYGVGDDRVIDTSVLRAENLGALLGTFVGSRMTGGHFLMAPLNAKEHAAQFERNDRARVLAALISPSTAAGNNILGNTIVAGAAMPRPLPIGVVKAQLETDEKAKVVRTQAEREIETFMKELARLGAKKDKAEARSYADKYIAQHGLKTGGSAEFRDMFTIDEDPGLAVLVEKKQRGHGMNDAMMKLGPVFFEFSPQTGRTPATISLFEPRTYPSDQQQFRFTPGEPGYLTWRSESIEPASPRELKDVRAKVESAWKREKARELAKRAAEELRKKIDDRIKAEKAEGQAGKVDQITSDVHSQFIKDNYGTNVDDLLRSKYYLQQNVSRLVPAAMSFQGSDGQPSLFGVQNVVRKEL
jgi:hypothetical protein